VTLGLDHQLTQRKLRRIRAVYGQGITQAEQQQLGYAEFLDELLSAEALGRQEKQIRRTLQAAGGPFHATLEQFDCPLRPERQRAVLVRFFDSPPAS
jgi:DNA replication protein DnaC